MQILIQLLLLTAGFAVLVKGADFFVDGASELAAKLKIPQLIIGLTVVAMGTSMPEAAVSISAALKGSGEITIGNILGSNILNILIILGLSAVLAPLPVERTALRHDMPFLTGVTVLLLLQGLDGTVGRLDGAVQLLFFAAYLFYLLRKAKREPVREEAFAKQRGLASILLLTAAGIAMTVVGSDLAVDAAIEIARAFGISERFIGLTVVASGTSLPELVTSVSAARKGNPDIAVGNIIGSNIFNILFIVGFSALITPVPFAAAFRFDNLAAAGAALALLLCCARSGNLRRRHGILLLAGYAAYFLAIL